MFSVVLDPNEHFKVVNYKVAITPTLPS